MTVTRARRVIMVTSMSADPFIARVVGRRRPPPSGQVPTPEQRSAFAEMAEYRTRAPKGVYRYRSHEEANRDRERWTVEAMRDSGVRPARP
jgi:hypothetical protein